MMSNKRLSAESLYLYLNDEIPCQVDSIPISSLSGSHISVFKHCLAFYFREARFTYNRQELNHKKYVKRERHLPGYCQ